MLFLDCAFLLFFLWSDLREAHCRGSSYSCCWLPWLVCLTVWWVQTWGIHLLLITYKTQFFRRKNALHAKRVLEYYGRQNKGLPKDVHVLKQWICYLTWQKRLCKCEQMEGPEMERLSRQPNVITRALKRRRCRGRGTERCDHRRGVGAIWRENEPPCIAAFENGEGSLKSRKTGDLRDQKRQRNRLSTETSRKEQNHLDTKVLAQWH